MFGCGYSLKVDAIQICLQWFQMHKRVSHPYVYIIYPDSLILLISRCSGDIKFMILSSLWRHFVTEKSIMREIYTLHNKGI